MQTWVYDMHDVLLIMHKSEEIVARIVRFEDSLDKTKPVYVNVRVAGGKRWSSGVLKIQPHQIIKPLPNWSVDQ